MVIRCNCPVKSRVQLCDIRTVRGRARPVIMEPGSVLELPETDAVVTSRYDGDIYKAEAKGWLVVVSEPSRTYFSPLSGV